MIIDPHGNPHFYVDLTDKKIRQLSALYAVVSEVRDTPIEDQPNPADVKEQVIEWGRYRIAIVPILLCNWPFPTLRAN
jgi:hypothetical protein